MVKSLPANAGAVGDASLISGPGRSPGGRHGNPLSILAWRIPWAEEPGGLQSMGSQRVSWTRLKPLSAHTHTHNSRYDLLHTFTVLQSIQNTLMSYHIGISTVIKPKVREGKRFA